MFNPYQLRGGDQVLVQVGKRKVTGRVVFRGRTYLSPIQIELADGSTLWFNSRTGTSAIVAGARLIDGKWQPL